MDTLRQRKKVLLVITKSNWGGAQRYVYDLATHLNTKHFTPVVALGGSGELATMLGHAGIPVVTLTQLGNSLSPKQAWAMLRELVALIRRERPDILHVNSSVAGLVGTVAGRLTRVPRIIFTCHGWAFNEDRPWWQRLIIKFLHWITVLLSHRTIAVSTGVLNEMRWLGAWKKMKVINPGRSIGAMYKRDEAREKICAFFPSLTPHLQDPWLVCIAELHPIKRHTVLIDAMKEVVQIHPNARLVCIGEGKERLALEQQINQRGLTRHVFLLGHLTDAARFLKAFDLMTLASKSESYGYVLHEAGLAGVPVVATNVGGIPDIVTHHQTGLLVPPDQPAPLAQAIIRSLNDPLLCNRFAQSLHATLEKRTTAHMTRAVESIFCL